MTPEYGAYDNPASNLAGVVWMPGAIFKMASLPGARNAYCATVGWREFEQPEDESINLGIVDVLAATMLACGPVTYVDYAAPRSMWADFLTLPYPHATTGDAARLADCIRLGMDQLLYVGPRRHEKVILRAGHDGCCAGLYAADEKTLKTMEKALFEYCTHRGFKTHTVHTVEDFRTWHGYGPWPGAD